MHRFRSPRSIFHSALAALLLLAMLAGQWTGLEHRVRHAGLDIVLAQPAAHGHDESDESDDHGYAHSCQLFDAAALGVGLHGAFLAARCLPAAQDWTPAWTALLRPASFNGHFSSRAPPSA